MFSLKPALPPLPPSRTGREIERTNFTDFNTKSILIEKARTTVTTLDLNDIINQLQNIYDQDVYAMKVLNDFNSIKRNELKVAKAQYDKMVDQYETLRSNTQIVDILNKSNLKGKLARLKASIKEFDNERRSQNPPPMALDKKMNFNENESPMMQYIHLTELNFQEIEACIYLMKKRGISVDQSDESLGMINSKYGNVTALVDKVKKLEAENEKLKRSETNFMLDAMTKRRQFGQLSSLGNRSISLILQSYISSIKEYGESLGVEDEKGGVNFEDICKDPTFTMSNMTFDENEISSNTSSTSSFTQMGNIKGGTDTLTYLQDLVTNVEQQCKKLIAQINSTPILPPNFTDFPTTTPEKMLQDNYESFLTIRERSRGIEMINEESVALVHAIMKAISEKTVYCGCYSKIIDVIKPLIISHTSICQRLDQNMSALNALFATTTSFGSSLLKPHPEPSLKEYIRNSCVYPDNFLPQSVSEKAFNNPELSPVKKKGKRRKSYKPPQPVSSIISKTLSTKSVNPIDFLVHGHQYELLAGLELTVNIGEKIGIKRDHQTSPITIIKSNLSYIQSMLKENLEEFDSLKTSSCQQVQDSASAILRKQFLSQKTQTDLMQLIDAEFQTEEEKKKHS